MLNEKALAAQAWADLEVSADATGELEVARVSLPIDKVRALVAERRAALPSSPVSELSDEQIVDIAVCHSNYKEDGRHEVFSHARIVEFARDIERRTLTTLTALAADKERLEGEVEKLREALTEIAETSRALRHGGPDPMDLNNLSDALNEATDIAVNTLAALSAPKGGQDHG